MPDRSKGMTQTKTDTLVLQVGGWAKPLAVKKKKSRNLESSLETSTKRKTTTAKEHGLRLFGASEVYSSVPREVREKWRGFVTAGQGPISGCCAVEEDIEK
jgi:hypothetical protein